MKVTTRICLLLALACALERLPAADIYVAAGGTAQPPYDTPQTGFPGLQNAIDASSAGDRILVGDGTFAGAAVVPHALTIRGNGTTRTVLQGDGGASVLTSVSGADVVIADLTIAGGRANYGGGINIKGGTLDATAVVVTDCSAGRGGGIYAEGAALQLRDSAIIRCRADNDFNDNGGKGGAIYLVNSPADGSADVDGCAFYANRGLYGGAVRLWNATARISRCQFFANRASYNVVDIDEFSNATLVDVLVARNQSLNRSALAVNGSSTALFCYLSVAGNESVAGDAAIYGGLFSALAVWNTAVQANVPDWSDLPPSATVRGGVFSTPPDGFGLNAVVETFSIGADGDFYLAADAATPSAFIGAGDAGCPEAVDPAARKIYVAGVDAGAPISAGYGYLPGADGAVAISSTPVWQVVGQALPFLWYTLEEGGSPAFSAAVQQRDLGPMPATAQLLATDKPRETPWFYRLRGTPPRGNVVNVTVADSQGGALDGTVVDVLSWPDLQWLATADTDEEGSAALANLPNATVTVLAGVGDAQYIPVYLGGTTDPGTAQTLTLADHATTATAAFTLDTGATIAGAVSGGGVALAQAAVSIYDSAGDLYKATVTDGNGAYAVGGLPPDSYRVGASSEPAYEARFWPAAVSLAAADPITIVGTETHTADLSLAALGHVAGTISLTDGGDVFQIAVVLYQADTFDEIAYTYADAQGHYDLYGAAGDVVVSAGEGSDYVVQYSTRLTLTAGATRSGIDFLLDDGGYIAGVVETAGGVPVPSVYVDFYVRTADGSTWIDSALTDSAGAYLSPALAPDTYYVQLYGQPVYANVWYVNSVQETGAQGVVVSRFVTVGNIDFTAVQAAGRSVP